MPSQELIQSKDAEVSAVTAICIYSDLLRSIWVGNGREPHQWGDFQGPNRGSGTLMLSAGVTHLSKTKTVLPWSPTETWTSFLWSSEGSGNQWQPKCGWDRPGWRAILSNRVIYLKLFAILDRNNSSTHSRALSEQQKKSQTRAPSPSHADSYSVIRTTWRWWLRWWFYCPQGIESGLGPHNLKYHHNISESWALPKITPCITKTYFISPLYV